jgi:hypothetical protein
MLPLSLILSLAVPSDKDLHRTDIAVPCRLRKPLHGGLKLRHLDGPHAPPDLYLGSSSAEHSPLEST